MFAKLLLFNRMYTDLYYYLFYFIVFPSLSNPKTAKTPIKNS